MKFTKNFKEEESFFPTFFDYLKNYVKYDIILLFRLTENIII